MSSHKSMSFIPSWLLRGGLGDYKGKELHNAQILTTAAVSGSNHLFLSLGK